MTLSFRFVSLALAAVLVLSGCRTYGDQGYGSEAKTYAAIQQIVQQLEQDLGRAQSDLRRLESAAESRDTLQALVDRYRTLVTSHEVLLGVHREQAERFTEDSSSRALSRYYGAMITDRRLLQLQYERTVRAVGAAVEGRPIAYEPILRQSNYSITPVQYPIPDRQRPMSMSEALQGTASTTGGQQEEPTEEED